jgi:hypothetical protein
MPMSLALSCFFMVCLITLPVAGRGELEIPSEGEPQPVLADTPQEVSVVFRNATASRQILSISMRTFQVSSSTLMPIDKAQPWKEIEISPGKLSWSRLW